MTTDPEACTPQDTLDVVGQIMPVNQVLSVFADPILLLLFLIYAASAGAMATPVGTPPNLIGIASIQETRGVRIGFMQWMLPILLRQPTPITLISDATGAMGEHVLQALFTQFPPGSLQLKIIPFVDSESALAQCLERLNTTKGLVVHATIYESCKRRIEAACRKHQLPVYDLTGPVMRFIASASKRRSKLDDRKLHELNPDYFKRVAAIEFAIAHDDSGGLKTLDQADVVLTGVSRARPRRRPAWSWQCAAIAPRTCRWSEGLNRRRNCWRLPPCGSSA